jgi:hypothetical protein
MIVEINPATDNLIEATDWNQPPDVLSRLVEFGTNTLVIIQVRQKNPLAIAKVIDGSTHEGRTIRLIGGTRIIS